MIGYTHAWMLPQAKRDSISKDSACAGFQHSSQNLGQCALPAAIASIQQIDTWSKPCGDSREDISAVFVGEVYVLDVKLTGGHERREKGKRTVKRVEHGSRSHTWRALVSVQPDPPRKVHA